MESNNNRRKGFLHKLSRTTTNNPISNSAITLYTLITGSSSTTTAQSLKSVSSATIKSTPTLKTTAPTPRPANVSSKSLDKLKKDLTKPAKARKILSDLKQIPPPSTTFDSIDDSCITECKITHLPCLEKEDRASIILQKDELIKQQSRRGLTERFTMMAFPLRSTRIGKTTVDIIEVEDALTTKKTKELDQIKNSIPLDRMSIFVCRLCTFLFNLSLSSLAARKLQITGATNCISLLPNSKLFRHHIRFHQLY